MEHKLTIDETMAYLFCHHDSGGLTINEAANRMKTKPRRVRALLQSIKKKAPQLFPILTKRQYLIYKMITEYGLTNKEVAQLLGTDKSNISSIINTMRRKGMAGLDFTAVKNIARYTTDMDNHILRKF